MDFKTYQIESRKTAQYPGMGQSVAYPLMGLLGECGELIEKFKKVLRDNNGELTQDRKNGIIGEVGDEIWYLFNLYTEACLDFEKEYVEKKLTEEIKKSPIKLLASMHCCISDIATFCVGENHVLLSKITEPSNTLLSCLKQICAMCGVSIEEAMQKNIDKLKSRKERNVISGDGDTR